MGLQVHSKYRNLILSIAIIGAIVAITFALFYKDTSGLGKSFNVAVIYIFSRQVGLYAGLIIFLLRVARLVKNKTLIYVFIGALNLFIALLCIALYFLHSVNMEWLNKFLLNLLIGFLIIADSFMVDGKSN